MGRQLTKEKQDEIASLYERIMTGEKLTSKQVNGIADKLNILKGRGYKFSSERNSHTVLKTYFCTEVDVEMNKQISKNRK